MAPVTKGIRRPFTRTPLLAGSYERNAILEGVSGYHDYARTVSKTRTEKGSF
jgi:hypothetical protein